ncbi:hypothetical protein ABFA07_002307 [Porites harrisoni]
MTLKKVWKTVFLTLIGGGSFLILTGSRWRSQTSASILRILLEMATHFLSSRNMGLAPNISSLHLYCASSCSLPYLAT